MLLTNPKANHPTFDKGIPPDMLWSIADRTLCGAVAGPEPRVIVGQMLVLGRNSTTILFSLQLVQSRLFASCCKS